MASGRIYFSIGHSLKFFVYPSGGIVLPSVTDPNDATAAVAWGFFELTLDANGVYANISFVDFVCLAIDLTLDTATGRQTVGGLVPTGLATIIAGLRSQATVDNTGWRELIVTRNGTVLRVLSPNLAALSPGRSGTFNGYLGPDIKQAWQK
jgi:hypothetical protein